MYKQPQHDIIIPPYLALPLTFPQSGQTVDWGHEYVGAADFYGKSKGEKAIIFILDTAGRFDHPDLVGNTLNKYGRNFTRSTTTADEHGHGTHCAGIAGAADNNIGVIGIAPAAKLVPVKVLDVTGGAWSWVANGIRYAADVEMPGYEDHKRIISMSLGGPSPSSAIEQAITYAISKGCFVTAAAGNSGYRDGQNSIGYPGRYENVITVASIGKSGAPSGFSSGGEEVDVAAPGEGILSTHLDGGYVYLSGTSMATPIVAGIMALIASEYGEEVNTQAKMEYFLEEYAKDIHLDGEDDQTGSGLPIVKNYLDQLPDTPPEDPAEPDPDPPSRDKRVLQLEYRDIPVLWRRWSSQQWHTDMLRLQIEVTTTTDADSTLEAWNLTVKTFFTNRAFVLLDNHDWADAGYWAARFFQMIVGKIYAVRVVEAEAYNAGGELLWPESAFAALTRSTGKTPRSFYLNNQAISSILKKSDIMDQYGIKETVDIFDAAISITEAVRLAKANDGKVDFRNDFGFFLGTIPKVITGIEGANQVPKELSDLSEQELNQLRAKFGQIIDDERYQRAFYGLAYAGDAILEIVQEKSQAPA